MDNQIEWPFKNAHVINTWADKFPSYNERMEVISQMAKAHYWAIG